MLGESLSGGLNGLLLVVYESFDVSVVRGDLLQIRKARMWGDYNSLVGMEKILDVVREKSCLLSECERLRYLNDAIFTSNCNHQQ